uniref:Uncharacterized protein n=1 Tax=Anas platyrhynchos platyrhynchos TaxID=8840 RepID=A0A493TEQ5_ANAPP
MWQRLAKVLMPLPQELHQVRIFCAAGEGAGDSVCLFSCWLSEYWLAVVGNHEPQFVVMWNRDTWSTYLFTLLETGNQTSKIGVRFSKP